jgi:hypothetical protein
VPRQGSAQRIKPGPEHRSAETSARRARHFDDTHHGPRFRPGAPRVQGPLIFLAAGDPVSNRVPKECGQNEALRGQVVMPPTSGSASEAVLASIGV